MRAINPFDGRVVREYADLSLEGARARLGDAERAWRDWRERPVAERAGVLARAAAVLRARRDEFARLMTIEMGKPIGAAAAEAEKCAWVCEHYAQSGPAGLAPEVVPTDASHSDIRFEPLGTLLAVMPWNFPFWQVFRAAAPALVAGNAVALKHASNVPGCALAIEAVWREAGLPAGIFTTLLVSAADALELIDHPAVAAVTLTGSEAAGRAVGARAGRALKKVVLELGGSDPFVVLAGCDPQAVAREACAARLVNNGQSCIAAKRFIVEAPLAAEFTDALVACMREVRVGDPLDPATQLGPLARPDLVAELHDQVRRTIAAGARCRRGGEPAAGPGAFYPATVLDDVEPGMAAFDEETFGPVAPVTRARDAAHAVELANRTDFGLGASVWCPDVERARSVAARIEAGAVFVNGPVKSDPRLPFGGIRRSGHGRELGLSGLREFVNVKSGWER